MAIEMDMNTERIDWTNPTVFDAITQLSVSLWLRPRPGILAGMAIFHRHDNTALAGWRVSTGLSDATKLRWELEAGSNGFIESSSGTLTVDTWTHVHLAYNGFLDPDDRARVWIDKVVEDTPLLIAVPAALGSPSKNLVIGQQSGALPASRMQIAECYAWVGVTITGAPSIAKIYRGCASLVSPTFLEFDSGLLKDPPVDRSKNELPPTITGDLDVVDHPPDVGSRSSCAAQRLRASLLARTTRRLVG